MGYNLTTNFIPLIELARLSTLPISIIKAIDKGTYDDAHHSRYLSRIRRVLAEDEIAWAVADQTLEAQRDLSLVKRCVQFE